MKPFGTGAAARPKDVRDWKIGLAQSPVVLPDVYMPDRSGIPVKMQGQFGTCGGHAGAAFASMLDGLDLAPKFMWREIKQFTGSPVADDAGTDMRSIFQAMQKYGVCHETLCPDVLDATYAEYSDFRSLTDAARNDAYPYGVDNYAFTDNPSWEQIRQAIYQRGAVIARVDCGDGWYVNGWEERNTCPVRLGNYDSGHFVVLWGYDQNYIYFRNSWSTAWGRNGDGYFDHSYLPHVTEIGVGIAAPSTSQKLVTKLTALILILKQLVALLAIKNKTI